MYTVYVAPIENIRKHPNADRLNIGEVLGHLIVLGKDIKEGDLGLLFPPDGQIHPNFLNEHDLYERHNEYGKKINKGYFLSHGKVRCINIRNIKTDGFWFPLKNLKGEYQKFPHLFPNGGEFTQENEAQYIRILGTDLKLARKVRSEDVHQNSVFRTKEKNQNQRKEKYDLINFEKHFSTPNWKTQSKKISSILPDKFDVYVTQKLHGTSQRTGKPLHKRRHLSLWQKILSFFGVNSDFYAFRIGTRQVNLPININEDNYRYKCVEHLKDKLKNGETLYHEVVGFTESGKRIQGDHSLKPVDGSDNVNIYSYDCKPHEAKIYVYRITQLENGVTRELSFSEMTKRCMELGVKTVPLVLKSAQNVIPHYNPEEQKLYIGAFEYFINKSVFLQPKIAEGVVLRFETPQQTYTYKLHSADFVLCSSKAKEQEVYEDVEEAS